MKCISNPKSMGITEPLLVLKLCFPSDLWSLWGAGRNLCDYCLHTDLYLTFNYLRGSAACVPIHPFFWDPEEEKEPSLVSDPCLFPLSVSGTKLNQRCAAPLAASHSSPESGRLMSLTFIHSVGSEKRLKGNMKLLSTGYVTLNNTPQRPINFMLWESHKPLLWAHLLCKNTIARFYSNNKLLIRILRILFRHDLNLLDPKPRSWLNKNTISDCFSHNRCVYRLILHVIYYLWCWWDTSAITILVRRCTLWF